MQENFSGVTADQMDVLIFRLEELLEVLGSIQSFVIFFVVVVLFYFSYKFLRIFL